MAGGQVEWAKGRGGGCTTSSLGHVDVTQIVVASVRDLTGIVHSDLDHVAAHLEIGHAAFGHGKPRSGCAAAPRGVGAGNYTSIGANGWGCPTRTGVRRGRCLVRRWVVSHSERRAGASCYGAIRGERYTSEYLRRALGERAAVIVLSPYIHDLDVEKVAAAIINDVTAVRVIERPASVEGRARNRLVHRHMALGEASD